MLPREVLWKQKKNPELSNYDTNLHSFKLFLGKGPKIEILEIFDVIKNDLKEGKKTSFWEGKKNIISSIH